MKGIKQKAVQKRWRDIFGLTLFVIALAIPFLDQPFHMDDNLYMDLAGNALEKPFCPTDMPYVFEGEQVTDLGSNSHPLFQTYFLALIQWIFGEANGNEWIYHTISLIFPILAVISFYFLSLRFLAKPLWASFLFACCPVFLVMQHNLMTDVPNLSFWLASIVTFLHANERDSAGTYVASSLFQFCAMFTSYTSLSLAPLLGFYHFRSNSKTRGWICLLVPIILMIIWLIFNCIHYNRFILAQTASFVQERDAWSLWKLAVKFGAILQYQGWLIILPVFLLPIFVRSLRRPLILLALLVSVCATFFASTRYFFFDRIIYALGILVGLAMLYHIAIMPLNRRNGILAGLGWTDTEKRFLQFWYLGVMAYCILIYPDGSARYILPLVPPVIIYFCHMLENTGITSSFRPLSNKGKSIILLATIPFTAFWGLALSHADFEFAAIYPRAARDFAPFAEQAESYYGGEWGFRYYFSKAGFKQMRQRNHPLPPGSLLVRPNLAVRYELSAEALDMSTILQQRTYKVKNPLRLLDAHSTAGFYSTYYGKLPFSLSWKSLETIEVRAFFSSRDHSQKKPTLLNDREEGP